MKKEVDMFLTVEMKQYLDSKFDVWSQRLNEINQKLWDEGIAKETERQKREEEKDAHFKRHGEQIEEYLAGFNKLIEMLVKK